MPYKVELNRHTKTGRLVWHPTVSRDVAPRRMMGAINRRVVKIGGRQYHVTKGWRREVV